MSHSSERRCRIQRSSHHTSTTNALYARFYGPPQYGVETEEQNNVFALTDAIGNTVDRYAYDLWGKLASSSESVPQQLRYAGYWYDQELGWYWLITRVYDPALERFLSPDGSQQEGLFTYAYAGDDPVDYNDKNGMAPAPIMVWDTNGVGGGMWVNYYDMTPAAQASFAPFSNVQAALAANAAAASPPTPPAPLAPSGQAPASATVLAPASIAQTPQLVQARPQDPPVTDAKGATCSQYVEGNSWSYNANQVNDQQGFSYSISIGVLSSGNALCGFYPGVDQQVTFYGKATPAGYWSAAGGGCNPSLPTTIPYESMVSFSCSASLTLRSAAAVVAGIVAGGFTMTAGAAAGIVGIAVGAGSFSVQGALSYVSGSDIAIFDITFNVRIYPNLFQSDTIVRRRLLPWLPGLG